MLILIQKIKYNLNNLHIIEKPENFVFIDSKCERIKLIDFGHAINYEENRMYTQKVGTPYYISPDVLRKKYNYKADIWSLGIVYMFMMINMRPYDNATIELLFDSILN